MTAPGTIASGTHDPRTYDYSHPDHVCDMVMKGGITSGVVYPFAVCEIARKYRLKSVGGASAGAIAAAAAAAAEFGRHSPGGGFEALAELPGWLGTGTNLFDLFQPQSSTRGLYRVFTAPVGHPKGRTGRVARAAMWNFRWWAVVGLAPGILLALLGGVLSHGFTRGLAVGIGVVLALLGLASGTLIGLYRTGAAAIPANGFGLCSGFRDPDASSSEGVPPLTEWLAGEIDLLAGKPKDADHPLTFGELREGPTPPPAGSTDPGASGTGEPVIDLQMMTTCLTQGRPYRLPLTDTWFFDPASWGRLFPKRVVKWLIDHPPAPPEQPAARRWWELLCKLLEPCRPLPGPADLPVVVAARMSLSFPILVSAVPLMAVDWSRAHNQKARSAWDDWLREHQSDWDSLRSDPEAWARVSKPGLVPQAAPCWFSDGGITSNFPVHFFDAPIPRWPTFAINLRSYHPDHPPAPDECDNFYMPATNSGGLLESWTDLSVGGGIRALVGFGRSIVDTMQNWVDSTQLRVPGYRDRVAHVQHTHEEGGINLNMPPALIEALSERGRCAGAELARRFAVPSPRGVRLNWDNHRWVRFRTTMALLEDWVTRYKRAYLWPPATGTPSYAALADRAPAEPPPSYRWARSAQQSFGVAAATDVVNTAATWEAVAETLAEGAPEPLPELRVRPRV